MLESCLMSSEVEIQVAAAARRSVDKIELEAR